ncbi:MAG: pitrilysin family protein [Candidatus Limnocylindrales bacterium]|jgi:zinc protease
MTLEEVLAVRPSPGQPRAYSFPKFERTVLPSGLQVLAVHVPGRPLVSANLIFRTGAADEPADLAGATVLTARSMTEGTERYPGLELIEAAERLGSTLHADASWDAFAASVEVAASRLRAALELLDELVARPTFPAEEVARLRDERLNDLLQLRAEPRRRVEQAFSQTIYTAESPYSRLAGGDESTVERLTRDELRTIHRAVLSPDRAALVVGGDLTGLDVPRMAEEVFGSLARDGSGASGGPGAPLAGRAPVANPAVDRPIVRLYDRPGSVQSEVRIGHVGLPRRVPDFHAVQVMAAILGGLFNSRLQLNLREEKGYTYGVGAGFDMRRGAGPFGVRMAVQTAVTVPAISEALKELRRMRETLVTDAELALARDYMVGVFPLRFETPGAVVGAIGGLFVNDLPDDELARYRGLVEAVTAQDVRQAAQDHIHPERLAIVLVGDADVVVRDLEAAGFGELEVIHEEPPGETDGPGAPGGAEEGE